MYLGGVGHVELIEGFFGLTHNIIYGEEMIKHASMQLESRVYNWYMWWKITTKNGAHNWKTTKNDFFKIFEDLKEREFLQRSPDSNRK